MAFQALENCTALVTGASSGVGRGIALELARAGCKVAVNYHVDTTGAAQTVAEIQRLGGNAFGVKADVGSSPEVIQMFEHVLSRTERLNILVNNAGVQTWASLLELRESDWDRDINTNLKGCFLCTQVAARHMKQKGGGEIINIGSGCNKVPFPRLVAYTASKGGIEMFTKVAAIELAPYSIRVNCVAPGAILIERTQLEDGEYAKTWGKAAPVGRVGTPADVGRAVVFLASVQASYISGQTIWVDGALFTKPYWPYDEETEAKIRSLKASEEGSLRGTTSRTTTAKAAPDGKD
jgi:NAD(P)-dependent dehydrogenase (short-subunit alcohol dehydrogenase family)